MASPLQVANAQQQRVSRNPQTTAPPAGGPFTRQTRRARLFGFSAIAQKFGELISQPLKPVPGYLQGLDITIVLHDGDAGKATVAVGADGIFPVLGQIQVIDAFGNPIQSESGFSLAAINVFSGQCGFWSPLVGGITSGYQPILDSDGNGSVHLFLPFELFAGFCSIPAANASAVPNLRIVLGSSGSVFITPPDTLPVIDVTVEEAYNSIGLTTPNAEPPDNGASHQWFEQPCSQGIGSAGATDVQLPPLGGWMDSLILIGRDSTGVRSDAVLAAALNTQTALWIDNVPEFQELFGTRKAWMDEVFQIPDVSVLGTEMRDGVLVYQWKDAAATYGPVSALDTGDAWVDTNPGTIVQFKGTSGTITNAPGVIQVVSGRVYTPSGIPYTHLSD